MQLDDMNSGLGAMQNPVPVPVGPAPMVAPVASPDATVGQAALAQPAQPDFGSNPLMLQQMIKSGAVRLGRGAKNIGTEIMSALDHVPLSDKPGSWARSVLAAGQKAMTDIGDIDTTPTQQGPAGGFLEGFAGTAANTRKREADEAKAASEEDMKRQQLQLQKDQTAANIALTQMQTYHTQVLVHQMGEQAIQESIKNDAPYIAAEKANGVKPIAEGITYAEAKAKGYLNDPSSFVVKHEGQRTIDHDEKTGDQHESLYTILPPPKDRKLTKDEATMMGPDWKEGDTVRGDQYLAVMTKKAAESSVKTAIAENLAKLTGAEISKATADVEMDPKFTEYFQDAVSKAITDAKKQGIVGTFDPEVAAGYLERDSRLDENSRKYARRAFISHMDEDLYKQASVNFKAQVAARAKEREDEDKARRSGQIIGDERLMGDPKAYWESIDPATRATIQAVGEGRADVGRLSYLLARNPKFMDVVSMYYPDFSSANVEGFKKAVVDFGPSGKVGMSVGRGGTVVGHLKDLYQLAPSGATDVGSMNPAGERHSRYGTKTGQVAEEMAGFYKGTGSATDQETEHWRTNLETKDYWNRRTNIEEAAKGMLKKMDEYESQWDQNAPSKQYKGQMPTLSNESWLDLYWVLNHGQAPDRGQAAALGATSKALVDGKWTYINETGRPIALVNPTESRRFKTIGQMDKDEDWKNVIVK